MAAGLDHFVETTRATLTWDDRECVRVVYHSEVVRLRGDKNFEGYMANRVPYFYRDASAIAREMGEGSLFLEPLRETLSRLPTAESFQDSHFAEILAAEFAQEVLGLRILYNKLSILTTENANAFKMDLVLYDPTPEPIEFVFGEVKCSPKSKADGLPAGHDRTAFPSLFDSFNDYKRDDLEFDLGAIKDHLEQVPPEDLQRIRDALRQYAGPTVRYAGFCVIDDATHNDDEIGLLATRRNEKTFDVDLLCVVELSEVMSATYRKLEEIREALSTN